MIVSKSFLAHWYFHVPNLILAALIYLVIGRYLLGLALARHPSAAILRIVGTLADPVLGAVRSLTPRIVPEAIVAAFAVCWLTAARMVWYLACVAAGMRVQIGG